MVIYCMIADAIKKRFPDTTELAMNKVLSTWLSGSADREGGRKLREGPPNPPNQ